MSPGHANFDAWAESRCISQLVPIALNTVKVSVFFFFYSGSCIGNSRKESVVSTTGRRMSSANAMALEGEGDGQPSLAGEGFAGRKGESE